MTNYLRPAKSITCYCSDVQCEPFTIQCAAPSLCLPMNGIRPLVREISSLPLYEGSPIVRENCSCPESYPSRTL